MSAPDLSLLTKRRYGPLFVVQFLGAFNDNVLKFALLFLANFDIYANQPDKAEMLAAVSTGIFILPYFFLSSLAGQIADTIDKARVIRWVKGAEIAIMALGLAGLWWHSVPVLLVALFLMGVHSTLFGPVKYSILPQQLGAHEIMGGTGLVEAGTFVAILGGQLLAGVIRPWEAGLVAMALAVAGFVASLLIPPAPPSAGAAKRLDWNIARGTWAILKTAQNGRGVWLAVLGIAWFFAAGAVLVSEFAPLASVLSARQEVVTLFLTIFSLCVAAGSLTVNRLLNGAVSARYVPVAALMMAGFLILLWLATAGFNIRTEGASIGHFLKTPGAWAVLAGLAGVAFSGGMFVVPLFAIIQVHARPEERSQVLAAANVVNAGATIAVVGVTTGLLALGVKVPGKPTFAIHARVAQRWWVRLGMKLFEAFPVDPTNPMATKAMVRAVKEGRTLVIFPEGRITETGALMKIFDGPGMVASKAGAPLIPVRIDGAQHSSFSMLKGKLRTRAFPKITLTVLPPRTLEVTGEMTARARRQIAGQRLYDEMAGMMFATSNTDRTLFQALVDAAAVHGRGFKVLEDVKRDPLTYGKLLIGTDLLGQPLAEQTAPGEAVGLLLPNLNATVVAFFALQRHGRVPAMLNFTAGEANLDAACSAAQVKLILTARAFIAQGKLGDLIAALEAGGRRVVYLEDLAAAITPLMKLRAALARGGAARAHAKLGVRADDPAVILFTSGSEGLPKGVVLTHRNLLANCQQLTARIDFNSSDVVLNALPVFHSFGLTGGTLVPVLSGVRTLLYPSPLHYRIIPALAYDANATILFGTDTFLSGYARMGHGYDFYALRYVFAGAERVRDETRRLWADKFGVRLFEGYGATECAPVIAVNTPMHFKAGSVGRPLPGVELRLEPVPGIEEGGRLFVRGPNVMAGYLRATAPGVLEAPEGGWHDTGDIVTIDAGGFVTIKGRAKRFAKIGGEMISLPAVEGYAARLWPEAEHAVVSRPDARKGEQLVMFTTQPGASLAALQLWARGNGVAEIALPAEVRVVSALPVLGTGKLDYVTMTAEAVQPAARAA